MKNATVYTTGRINNLRTVKVNCYINRFNQLYTFDGKPLSVWLNKNDMVVKFVDRN